MENHFKPVKGSKNIVTLYDHFVDEQGKMNLVLERGLCSLVELINWYNSETLPPDATERQKRFLTKVRDQRILGEKGQSPTPCLLNLLRGILFGLKELKDKNIKHDHLTADNVLIFEDYKAKLVMSKHERQTLDFNDRDTLSIAGIIYYLATLGENVQIRNKEITTRRIRPDLDDLINTVYGKIRNLPYQFYPNHVAFWTPSTKLQMICEASSRLYKFGSVQNMFLESKKEDLHGGNIDWSAAINREKPGLWAAVTSKGEGMTTTSTCDLVRFIRNAYVHRRDNKDIKSYFGGVELKLFADYFERLYPGLLTRLYALAVHFWRKEEAFLCFYNGELCS